MLYVRMEFIFLQQQTGGIISFLRTMEQIGILKESGIWR